MADGKPSDNRVVLTTFVQVWTFCCKNKKDTTSVAVPRISSVIEIFCAKKSMKTNQSLSQRHRKGSETMKLKKRGGSLHLSMAVYVH